jgi:hypothetical protein
MLNSFSLIGTIPGIIWLLLLVGSFVGALAQALHLNGIYGRVQRAAKLRLAD